MKNKSRTNLLLLFQLLYWSAHWLINFMTQPDKWSRLPDFFDLAMTMLLGFLLTLLITFLYHKYSVFKFPLAALIPVTVISSVCCGLLLLFGGIYITWLLTSSIITVPGSSGWIKYLTYNTYPFVIWSALYYCYEIWNEWKIQKIKAEEEKSLAQSAQLEMLRYQLNPHFLFNTLSSLRALIRIEPRQAEQMVTRISEFLRYSLSYEDENLVPLSREIEIIKYYLDIEKVRFGEKICTEFFIDKNCEDRLIPVFLIHPLVENAVKYGQMSGLKPLLINISAFITGGDLQIEVMNSGTWCEQNQGDIKKKGKGLENVRKRLELSYPGKYTFDIIKTPEQVSVKICLLK